MSANYYELSEFCRQLELLTKAGLPLPGALENIAAGFRKKDFRDIVSGLGKDVSGGKTLADAMRGRPECFPSFFISTIEQAERQGALPEAFGELAESARVNYMLASLLRDVLLYPLITVSIGLAMMLLLCFFVIPGFRLIFSELMEGAPLPLLTRFVLDAADLVRGGFVFFAAGYLLYLGWLFWLFSGAVSANRILLRLIKLLPLSEMVFYNFAMSSVCALWAVMMRRGVPEKDALETVSLAADYPALFPRLELRRRELRQRHAPG